LGALLGGPGSFCLGFCAVGFCLRAYRLGLGAAFRFGLRIRCLAF
jgi:hypothetical protein